MPKGLLRPSPISVKKKYTTDELYKMNENNDMVYKYYSKEDDETIKKQPGRCMCINYKNMDDFKTFDRCPNKATPCSHFCDKHQNCQSYLRKMLSGSESSPDTFLWNDPLIEGSHNCYSYFLNRQIKAIREYCNEECQKNSKNIKDCIEDELCNNMKPQPGDFHLLKL